MRFIVTRPFVSLLQVVAILMPVTVFLGTPTIAIADNQTVYQELIHSTALIVSPRKGDELDANTPIGTGVVVDAANPKLVTAYHVVQERKHVMVVFPKFDQGRAVTDVNAYLSDIPGNSLPGTVVYTDSKLDLAIISMDSLPANTVAVPIASQASEPTENLLALGCSSISRGILWAPVFGMVQQPCPNNSMTLRTPGNDGTESCLQDVSADLIEAQLPLTHGDSGGPVVNLMGELVGIVSSVPDDTTAFCFLIDASQVRTALLLCPAPESPLLKLPGIRFHQFDSDTDQRFQKMSENLFKIQPVPTQTPALDPIPAPTEPKHVDLSEILRRLHEEGVQPQNQQ